MFPTCGEKEKVREQFGSRKLWKSDAVQAYTKAETNPTRAIRHSGTSGTQALKLSSTQARRKTGSKHVVHLVEQK
jgi:hypothetical protein